MSLSHAEKVQYAGLLEEKIRRKAERQIEINFSMMYDWQREFVAATNDHYESCLCCGNQVGKTFTGTEIDAAHLTGDYPEGWEGFRFTMPPLVWCLGYSMEKTRDLLQTALFGEYQPNKGFAGGIVPKDRIVVGGWQSAGGTVDAMRTVSVKHASGGISRVQFWSYTQRQHAIMGDIVDFVHVDEEPQDQKIRPQLLMRTANGDNGRGGRIIYTFTPENGRTELVVKFKDNPSANQFYMQKGWSDAPHMTKEKRDRLREDLPSHMVPMREKGEPMLGHGLIFQLSEDFVQCDMPDIQPSWFVIDGMDFGDDHPQAHVKLIEDRDNGMFYVTNAYKARKTSANDAWGAVKRWAEGIPTAWPHDGLQGEKGRDNAKQLKDHYVNAGFNMLANHATWTAGGNSVETGLFEIGDLMRKGLFKIVRGVPHIMEEYRSYHREEVKNGPGATRFQIVKANDDILDAVRYAYMMRRYAVQVGNVGAKPMEINFQGWYA